MLTPQTLLRLNRNRSPAGGEVSTGVPVNWVDSDREAAAWQFVIRQPRLQSTPPHSVNLARCAHCPPDAMPDKVLSLGERIPVSTPDL
jgi:hypothetical protein